LARPSLGGFSLFSAASAGLAGKRCGVQQRSRTTGSCRRPETVLWLNLLPHVQPTRARQRCGPSRAPFERGLGRSVVVGGTTTVRLSTEENPMKLPLQVTFRDVPKSEEIERRIRTKAEKLDRMYEHVTGCRVVVEAPHRHHNSGNHYHVRVELSVPGGEIIVSREPHDNAEHEDLWVTIRDAFNAAQRQLQSFSGKRASTTSGRFRAIPPELRS
jgi:ribosome-associated translation inhibitor RaiA